MPDVLDRDELVRKDGDSTETWNDDLTPPPQDVTDPIEEKAVRIQRRTDTIQQRPGDSPSPSATIAAITIDGVAAELQGVKTVVESHGTTLVSINTHVKTLATAVSGLGLQMTQIVPVLVKELTEDRAAKRQQDQFVITEEHLTKVTKIEHDGKRAATQLEIDAAQEKADIDIATAAKKARIDRVTRVLAVIFGLATALLTASKC